MKSKLGSKSITKLLTSYFIIAIVFIIAIWGISSFRIGFMHHLSYLAAISSFLALFFMTFFVIKAKLS